MIVSAILNYIFDSVFLYQLIASLSTYLILVNIHIYRVRYKRYQIFKYYGIDGPERSLLSGNFFMSVKTGATFEVDQQLRKKFGKVYSHFIGDLPVMIITDLDILKQIYFVESSVFTERTRLILETPLSRGILFAPYHRWKMMRKILTPPFRSQKMKGGTNDLLLNHSIGKMIKYIEAKLDLNGAQKNQIKGEVVIDILSLTKSATLHLISDIAINLPDVQVKENEDHVKELDNILTTFTSSAVVLAIMFPIFVPLLQFIANNFEYDIITQKINRGINSLITNGLARIKKNKQSTKEQLRDDYTTSIDTMVNLLHDGKLTKEELKGNAWAILVAGYDTTATLLVYVFWILAKNPDIQERLRSEVRAHGIDSEYLMQVINETLRLYPNVISFTSRMASKTIEINGVVIPQGTAVIFNNWLIHRDPDIWKNPYRFDPNRFAGSQELHPCAFAPFGLGDRKCLGMQLALLETKSIVCEIILRYKLKLKAPENLRLMSCAISLSKPRETVLIAVERLKR